MAIETTRPGAREDAYEQDLVNLSEVLKENWLPMFRNAVNTEASPFLQKIKKKKLTADVAVAGARVGIDGGFGMSEERYKTPEANAPIYSKFKATSKDAYVELHISQKALLLARNNPNNLIDSLVDQIEASKEAAIWNTGRMLFGDGSGKLATVESAPSNNQVVVDELTNLIVGLSVDIFNSGADENTDPAVKAIQIASIDYEKKLVTFRNKTFSGVEAGAFLVAQNSRNREITGLKTIFDGSVGTIYGLEKEKNPIVIPYSKEIPVEDFDDIDITDAVTVARRRSQSHIDMMLCGENAFRMFEETMHKKQMVIAEKQKYVGGAVGYKVISGRQETEVVLEPFVPADKIWGVDTNAFELHETGWDFATHKSSVFNLMPGTSAYRALMANYLELICRNPGGCVELVLNQQ